MCVRSDDIKLRATKQFFPDLITCLTHYVAALGWLYRDRQSFALGDFTRVWVVGVMDSYSQSCCPQTPIYYIDIVVVYYMCTEYAGRLFHLDEWVMWAFRRHFCVVTLAWTPTIFICALWIFIVEKMTPQFWCTASHTHCCCVYTFLYMWLCGKHEEYIYVTVMYFSRRFIVLVW